MALIELRHLRKSFGFQRVLNDVNLQVEKGQSLVILGVSGSGKSVILKHMVGLMKPDRGQVFFDGRQIDNLPERQLVPIRQRFGFLFQMGALFDSITVADNIAFPLHEHTTKPEDEIQEIVQQKLRLVGLPEVGKKMPAELSGGQRKRVALARAIALNPEVILYDEPTTGLDPIRSDVINELILKLREELHVTSIVVTHDMQSAFKVGQRFVMLHEGKFIFDGNLEEIQNSQDATVKRFISGEASPAELATLKE